MLLLRHTRRRDLITLLGGAAAAWQLPARAEPARRTIGYLGSGTPLSQGRWVAAFVDRMRELNWVDGRNIGIEYRWGEGRSERFAEIAAEFVRLKVDVIVTSGAAAVLAARQATSAIPIVFGATADPVGAGLVASLARPGGNVTGLSVQSADFAGKQIELLRELVPGFRKLGIITNGGSPGPARETVEIQAAARTLGLEVMTEDVRSSEEMAAAFDALTGQADALYCVPDPLIGSHRAQIIALAQKARLPTVYGSREYVERGGLISYGPNIPDLFRRAAEYVDKILRGVRPADIPVEQPTRFDLVVNLTTARALGLEVPPTLLARADEVIE
jgi:putative ABC transport system substrate-binding protein